MRFYITKYAFFAPSLHTVDDWKLWTSGKKEIGDDDSETPDVSFVPPMQRRKMTQLTRIIIGLADNLSAGGSMPAVYSSVFGEWGLTQKQLQKYYEEKEVSPAGFGLSVHNAAAGQYSILKGSRCAYTCIAGTGNDFDAGLLEAVAMLTREEKVMYVSAGEKIPDLYKDTFDEVLTPMGIGLILSREPEAGAIGIDADFASPRCMVQDYDHMLSFVKFILNGEQKFSGSNYHMETAHG